MRQRAEQNFTLSQSRAHFFRHTNGRRQTTQSLLGRSDFRRIRTIRSPRHRLATPVKETTIVIRRELTNGGKQMAGRCYRSMYF